MGWASQADIRMRVTDDDVSGFRATIGAERNLGMIAFLSVWLAGWAVGELAVLGWIVLVPVLLIGWGLGLVPPVLLAKLVHDASGRWPEILIVAFIWFPFWTLAGMIIFRALRWQLGGREVIAIHEGVLELRRETGLSRRSLAFELSGVRNLRYAPEPTVPAPSVSFNKSLRAMQVMLRAEGGSIAFDHDGHALRFGIGLSESEANRLITTIRERFSALPP